MGIDLTLIPLASSPMDVDLRRLKRKADSGDTEALRQYCHMLERITDTKGCHLLPLDYMCHLAGSQQNPKTWPITFSHIILPLGRDYDLWERIEALPQLEVSEKSREHFSCYLSSIPDGRMEGESCYGNLREDCYGNKLQWVEAGPLAKAIQENIEAVEADDTPCDVAISTKSAAAYLAALQSNNPVALYWH